MPDYQRLQISEVTDVTVVNFTDNRIIDSALIEELGAELLSLVADENRHKLLLNFAHVEFLSSAALNKLIRLDKNIKEAKGSLRLSNLRPQITQIFEITRLTQIFQIFDTEAEALASF